MKRYECYEYEDTSWPPYNKNAMREDVDGEYVLHADHLADRAELLALLRRAEEALDFIEWRYGECPDCGAKEMQGKHREGGVNGCFIGPALSAIRAKLEEEA